jgi:predicted nucleotidyltransferase
MKVEEVTREFRQKIEKLYGKRLKNIILYGSYARGQATEDSDIDLAVILEGEVDPCREIDAMIDLITDINLDFETLLSVFPLAATDFKQLNSPLLLNLRKEGKPV